MRKLQFVVSGQTLIKSKNCDFNNIVAGTAGYLEMSFVFNKEWEDMIIAAAFTPYMERGEYASIVNDGTCVVPREVSTMQVFRVGIVGESVDGRKITTNLITIRQERGAVGAHGNGK